MWNSLCSPLLGLYFSVVVGFLAKDVIRWGTSCPEATMVWFWRRNSGMGAEVKLYFKIDLDQDLEPLPDLTLWTTSIAVLKSCLSWAELSASR